MSKYTLKCLFVDLDSRSVRFEQVPQDISLKYIGGRGIATHLLGLNPMLKAGEPETTLIFSAGPLTGSRLPSTGRMTISSFSPLTNTITSSSVGGNLGIQMRMAGLDVIHITGKSRNKLVLCIQDRDVSFEDVALGEDTPLQEVFLKLSSRGSVAAVGSAGFHGCLFASIMVDGAYAAGRGGLGYVMASKNLVAVTVRGSHRPGVGDRYMEGITTEDILRLFDASPAIMGVSGIHRYGTVSLVDLMASRRMMPTANFRKTFFEQYRAFSASRIVSTFKATHNGCYACPIRCKLKSDGGKELPEFETVSHFGALNENADLMSIIEANRICNEVGMDTITAASTIACLAEIREKKYTGDTLVGKVKEMASGKGLGELLQMGSRRLAEELGQPGTSMSVKSMEIPAYDPRGAYGMALGYCTSTRGACHLRAYPISHEILRRPVATDRFSFQGKARIIKIAEDVNAAIDSMGACKFAFFGASMEEYALGMKAVTGLEIEPQDLITIGERIFTLERYINCQRGFAKEDDFLPARFYKEHGTPGPGLEIPPIERALFKETLERYYRVRGCSPDGVPTEKRLKELDII